MTLSGKISKTDVSKLRTQRKINVIKYFPLLCCVSFVTTTRQLSINRSDRDNEATLILIQFLLRLLAIRVVRYIAGRLLTEMYEEHLLLAFQDEKVILETPFTLFLYFNKEFRKIISTLGSAYPVLLVPLGYIKNENTNKAIVNINSSVYISPYIQPYTCIHILISCIMHATFAIPDKGFASINVEFKLFAHQRKASRLIHYQKIISKFIYSNFW